MSIIVLITLAARRDSMSLYAYQAPGCARARRAPEHPRRLSKRLDRLENQMTEMGDDIAAVKADVAAIPWDVAAVQAFVHICRSDLQQITYRRESLSSIARLRADGTQSMNWILFASGGRLGITL